MKDDYPQVRISPEAHAHLRRVLPMIRKQRGYKVPMTSIASEAILSIDLPKNGKGLELPAASETAKEPGGKS